MIKLGHKNKDNYKNNFINKNHSFTSVAVEKQHSPGFLTYALVCA